MTEFLFYLPAGGRKSLYRNSKRCNAASRMSVNLVTCDKMKISLLYTHQSINQNQKVNLYSASSIQNSQTCHLHLSTLKQPCLKSTLELFPGNVTAS